MPPKTVIDSLGKAYDHFRDTASSVNEHFETIRKYASRCKHITELGCSDMITCWPLAKGLTDNGANVCSLTCVDLKPAPDAFENVSSLIKRAGVKVKFVQGDSLKLRLQPVDLLYIDTFHCYPQLKRELEKHHGSVSKYIIVPNVKVDGQQSEVVRLFFAHDIDEACARLGNVSHEDICRGLMPAIEEFVGAHKDTWRIAELAENNNGLAVLERI
jgi:hypothetical protein